MGAALGPVSCTTNAGNATPLATPAKSYHDESPRAIAELCFAASRDDVSSVHRILKRGVSVNAADYDKRTPLHIAAADNKMEVGKVLIEAKANVNILDRWGQSPVDEASRGKFQEMLTMLIAAGGHVTEDEAMAEDPALSCGVTDEFHMEEQGDVAEFEEAMGASGADVYQLCNAAAAGSVQLMEQLVTAKADVNAVDYDGRSALHIAASYGHRLVAKWLIDQRADVSIRDNRGMTALADAQTSGNEDLAKVIMEASNCSAEAMELEALRVSGQTGHWSIPRDEVEFGELMSTTLKSAIYHAKWRGLSVVAKTSGFLTKNFSSKGALVDLGKEDTTDSDQERARVEMLHEINILYRMRHPDLVMFLGACLDTSPCFFITEFMEGGDMERYYMQQTKKLGRHYRASWALFLKWANAVSRALCFLHNCHQPVIHRDLKPLNLLLNRSQDVKVADFGISKLMTPKQKSPSNLIKDTTAAPMMSGGVGTWRYMAPEVVRYEQYTDRVDIYSFSLIMFFMSTGCAPFAEQFRDAEEVLKAYVRGEEPRPDLKMPGLAKSHRALRDLLTDCWHPKPEERPSAKDCTERLAQMHASSGSGWRSMLPRLVSQ